MRGYPDNCLLRPSLAVVRSSDYFYRPYLHILLMCGSRSRIKAAAWVIAKGMELGACVSLTASP